jgi:hypothetical protein
MLLQQLQGTNNCRRAASSGSGDHARHALRQPAWRARWSIDRRRAGDRAPSENSAGRCR